MSDFQLPPLFNASLLPDPADLEGLSANNTEHAEWHCTLAASAQTDPQQIKEAIKSNADGSYDVALWHDVSETGPHAGFHFLTQPIHLSSERVAQAFRDHPGAVTQALWPVIIEAAASEVSQGNETKGNPELPVAHPGWDRDMQFLLKGELTDPDTPACTPPPPPKEDKNVC